jgi:hypothetical protein
MFRVGASSSLITPTVNAELAGYGYYLDRVSTGVSSELQATAIALQGDDTSAVICNIDLLSIDADAIDKVRDAVAELRPDHPAPTLFISASHTHSGPGIRDLIGSGGRNLGYIDNVLVPRLAGTIANAFAQTRDGAIGVEGHDLPGVSFNRTGGTVLDTELTSIQFANEQQKIIGANFACHPTVHGKDSTLVSSDYPGVVRQALRQENVSDQAFWVTGFSGDVNPVLNPSLTAEQNARTIGSTIGRMASVLHDQITVNESGLETLSTIIDLPVDVNFELDVNTELDAFRQARNLPKTADLGPVKFWLENAQPVINEYSADTLPIPLTVIKMGHVVFVGLGAEIYSSTGLDLKQTHSELKMVTAMNTNEHQGYVPIERDYQESNYAARNSAFAFRRKPLTHDSENLLFQTVDMHLSQMSGY